MALSRIHPTRVSRDPGMAKYPSVPATLIAMAAIPLTSTVTSVSSGTRSRKPNVASSAPFSRNPAVYCSMVASAAVTTLRAFMTP